MQPDGNSSLRPGRLMQPNPKPSRADRGGKNHGRPRSSAVPSRCAPYIKTHPSLRAVLSHKALAPRGAPPPPSHNQAGARRSRLEVLAARDYEGDLTPAPRPPFHRFPRWNTRELCLDLRLSGFLIRMPFVLFLCAVQHREPDHRVPEEARDR